MSSTTNFQPGALTRYKALVFDCYGTLIDWETGIYTALEPLFVKSRKPSDRRSVIDAFCSVEADLQSRFPTMLYPDLLAKVYMTIAARLQGKETPPDALRDDNVAEAYVQSSSHTSQGTAPVLESDSAVGTSSTADSSSDPSPAEAFARSVATWPPFPDTVAALSVLSKRYKLIILSNIDRRTIAKTRELMEGPGAFKFDAVYTAEEVGAYKPAPEMLTYALKHLEADFGIAQDEVLMTAQSVFHDIAPAKARGIATAWINREDAVMKPANVKGDEAMLVFLTLGAVADAVEGTG